LRNDLTVFCLNLILMTITRLNGALARHTVEMRFVLTVTCSVRSSVHARSSFVSVVYLKRIHLVHASCGISGARNAMLKLQLLAGLLFTQNPAPSVINLWKRMVAVTYYVAHVDKHFGKNSYYMETVSLVSVFCTSFCPIVL